MSPRLPVPEASAPNPSARPTRAEPRPSRITAPMSVTVAAIRSLSAASLASKSSACCTAATESPARSVPLPSGTGPRPARGSSATECEAGEPEPEPPPGRPRRAGPPPAWRRRSAWSGPPEAENPPPCLPDLRAPLPIRRAVRVGVGGDARRARARARRAWATAPERRWTPRGRGWPHGGRGDEAMHGVDAALHRRARSPTRTSLAALSSRASDDARPSSGRGTPRRVTRAPTARTAAPMGPASAANPETRRGQQREELADDDEDGAEGGGEAGRHPTTSFRARGVEPVEPPGEGGRRARSRLPPPGARSRRGVCPSGTSATFKLSAALERLLRMPPSAVGSAASPAFSRKGTPRRRGRVRGWPRPSVVPNASCNACAIAGERSQDDVQVLRRHLARARRSGELPRHLAEVRSGPAGERRWRCRAR